MSDASGHSAVGGDQHTHMNCCPNPTGNLPHIEQQNGVNPFYSGMMQQFNTGHLGNYPLNQLLIQQLQNSMQLQQLNNNQATSQFMTPQHGPFGIPQQHAPFSTHVSPLNNGFIPSSVVNLPMVSSSPDQLNENVMMAQVYKRQIEDISKSLDTSVIMHQEENHPTTRRSIGMMSPKKLKTGADRHGNGNSSGEPHGPASPSITNKQQMGVTAAACRFATTRYPFAPFHLTFKSIVKDKPIIDELVTGAQAVHMELKIAAYRHKLVNNIFSLLIFVEDIKSFCFLNKETNWPKSLAGGTFKLKKPSTPAQLCLILPNVSLNVDWDDFVNDTMAQYPEVVNVIRLRNRNQRPIPTVKIELGDNETKNTILQHKEMTIGYMKYKVVEYLAPMQILICGNCCEIGHFQKNCPLKDESVCKICGTKYADEKKHECSGKPKCVRCGEDHKSTDAKCSTVKSYRAALTRNLLNGPNNYTNNNMNNKQPERDFQIAFANRKQQLATTNPYSSTESMFESLVAKKLDSFLAEIKVEMRKTQESIDTVRNEMSVLSTELNKKIEIVEQYVGTMDTEIQERINTIVNSIETILLVLNKNTELSSEDKTSVSSILKKITTNAKKTKNKQ